jgi:hypothetical protein
MVTKLALVNICNKLGISPFHYIALYGQADLISLLLDAGADPEARDNDSWTPLHTSTWHNKLVFIQKLYEVTPTLHFGARLKSGATSLYLAAEQGFLEVLEFFLE